MNQILMLAAIGLPILAGACQSLIVGKGERSGRIYTSAVMLLTSAITWALILTAPEERFALLSFTDVLTLVLRFDRLGRFFAGIIATLWPLTTLYAFEYMKEDPRKTPFFAFFTMAFGVTLGVAMAGNLFTMYCFYELLTLSTAPLVLHPNTKEAVRAARTYFAYSLGGAAFAFAAMIFLISNGETADFVLGGVLHTYPYARPQFTLIFYTLGFFGFGVKAAMLPSCRWLPIASAAPTPVTALLHAVAVVKSGVFAIIRLTWFAYGTRLLIGTWAQTVALCAAIATIFYGASRAVKETHWKRRLAWSTVANLSYIIFGAVLMTPAGLSAGLLHMAFHAEIKILAFFCCGAVLHQTGREYISELDGLGSPAPVRLCEQVEPSDRGRGQRHAPGLCGRGDTAGGCTADGGVHADHRGQGMVPRGRRNAGQFRRARGLLADDRAHGHPGRRDPADRRVCLARHPGGAGHRRPGMRRIQCCFF